MRLFHASSSWLRIPSQPLDRLGWLFLAFYLLLLAAMLPMLVFASAAEWSWRVVAGLGLAWLAWRGVREHRQRKPFALRWEILEFATLVLLGVCVGAQSTNGVLFLGLYCRALYGPRWRAIGTGVLYLGAYVSAGLIDADPAALAVQSLIVQGMGLILSGLIIHIAVTSLRLHQRSLAREKILARTGAALGAAVDREGLGAAVAGGSLDLLVTEEIDGAVIVWEGTPDHMTAIGVAGVGAEPVLDRVIHPGALPDDFTDALGSAGGPPVCAIPLAVEGQLRGLITVTSTQTLPRDCRDTLETLGAYVALAMERMKLAEDLHRREGEARFRALIQHASDVITIVDPDATIRFESPSVLHMLGYQPDALVGTSLMTLVDPQQRALVATLLSETLEAHESSHIAEWRVQHHDGSWRDIEVTSTNLVNDPDVRGIVLNCRDITERKAFEAQLAHHAFHDPLTGLPNRALFINRIEHAQRRARRASAQIAVLFVDLDNFKSVNERIGHAGGDQLLVAFAKRMQSVLREGDTIARFGGDEFGILIEDVTDTARVTEIADRCLAECRQPFALGEHDVSVEMSVGVGFGRPDLMADDLLREADVALSAAKARGKNCVDVFDVALGARTRDRLQLELDLRQAVPQGELRVYYQPIIALADGRIEGVEALVRWAHPRRGLVMPDEFIPLAEETGLIVPIGKWVLEQACAQVHAWRLGHPDYAAMGVSVNLSGRQFQRPDLVAEIDRAVRTSGLDPGALTLEITESVVMADPAAATATLHELKALGFAVSIDDFGTGYSSLSYLKHFPIDNLKIDRSFVNGLGSDAQDTAIVRSIVDLAQALHVTITAEGIETPLQQAALRALGCKWGQGYLFARPQRALALEAILEASAHAPDLPLAA